MLQEANLPFPNANFKKQFSEMERINKEHIGFLRNLEAKRVTQADEVIEGSCLWKAGVRQGRERRLYAQPCSAPGLPEQHSHFEKKA